MSSNNQVKATTKSEEEALKHDKHWTSYPQKAKFYYLISDAIALKQHDYVTQGGNVFPIKIEQKDWVQNLFQEYKKKYEWRNN